ncbi:membrane glycosyltransferase [Marivita hallyeonensis]|uniref:Glucans biosynthesis glucosyltransferase H n=1 Tax=Marivita hallyeonensis TaxID=996342 RepID=A0A1M5S7A1_9RHOB|nr:membrane glycosyltransferase [Marivita hallyeonensis]
MLVFVSLLAVLSTAIVVAFAQAVDEWTWIAWAVLPLMAVNAVWISGGAATAIIGAFGPHKTPPEAPHRWRARSKTAILVTLCGEEPKPVARHLASLASGLARQDLADATEIFVLSDTGEGAATAREDAAFSELIAAGLLSYRRRPNRTNRKPGNIADWFVAHGASFDHMIVLDADSRMSPHSIRHLIWTMEVSPRVGLCQAGISLVPGRTRFGRYQRVTSRLLSRTFGQGFAAWSGPTGNYWGHNAIIRTEAFRAAVDLPRLSGPPPFGGAILSHDFIEAAWIRRAGWDVVLCPNLMGSAEDAPQTLQDFFKRDRRWCQGNLQHVRLLAEPGLHGLSRFHLICGIFSYLAAPIWLVLLALLSSELISVWGFLPVLSIAAVLLVPKLCALVHALPRARTTRRRSVILRAWLAELALSTLLAPVIMLRQTSFVGAILTGRDSGWKSPERPGIQLPQGWPEAALGIVVLALTIASGTTGAFWLALVIVPLLAAPIMMRKLNEVPS